MRIISQDGKWDMPYELMALFIDKNKNEKYVIYAQGNFIGQTPEDNFFGIAEYSTEKKAVKAMELLQDTYGGIEIYKMFTNQQKMQFISVVTNEQCEKLSGLFRFPAENELEDEI